MVEKLSTEPPHQRNRPFLKNGIFGPFLDFTNFGQTEARILEKTPFGAESDHFWPKVIIFDIFWKIFRGQGGGLRGRF